MIEEGLFGIKAAQARPARQILQSCAHIPSLMGSSGFLVDVSEDF